jgi:glutamate/tyrosine decarboxylase-like PLP-dependent enzyme
MDRATQRDLLAELLDAHDAWAGEWGAWEPDETTRLTRDQAAATLTELSERLRENYPYPHPRYAGQMLKPPHPIAALAYMAAMQINPNNHALDGGIATSRLEREIVADLARMFGFETHLGHLTSSGTIANLEALWIARQLQPDRALAVSEEAHYTHARACELLGLRLVKLPSDEAGRLDLAALRQALRSERIGTVVATAGTTALGAVDQIQHIVPLARAAGARVHVDGAYGGFFTLAARRTPPAVAPEPFLAIAEADSVVVDPHKHGLQPYGCGAVLFRDPAVGRFYAHNSPYTYFTSAELHLGEISLECSRAGAAAAALWATLRCFPLQPERGLGAILARTRAAALRWAATLRDSARMRLLVEPELDIIAFYALPHAQPPLASAISALSRAIFDGAMQDPVGRLYLAKLTVKREQFAEREPDLVWDADTVTVLRSVLMKPEHVDMIPEFQAIVERQVARYEKDITGG